MKNERGDLSGAWVRHPVDSGKRSRHGGGAVVVAAALIVTVWLLGCAGPAPRPQGDPELLRLNDAARSVFDDGHPQRSAALYYRALQRARLMDDRAAIGESAYSLAACLARLDDLEQATSFLEEALAELAACGRSSADAHLLQARIARREARLDDAAACCREVLALSEDDLTVAAKAEAHLIEAGLACERGDIDGARREFTTAQRLLSDAINVHLQAEAAGVEGDIALLEGRYGTAAAAFDRAAAKLREAERFEEMAGALARAGRAFESAGALHTAADRFYRAARADFARGAGTAALVLLEDAAIAVGQASVGEAQGSEADHTRVLAQRIVALRAEIERSLHEKDR